MQEIEQLITNHLTLVSYIILMIIGWVKLELSSKSNGLKLDTVINENKTMLSTQQSIQFDVNKQGIQITNVEKQMSNVEKEMSEIKNEIRTSDKEFNQLNARLAAVECQLKVS